MGAYFTQPNVFKLHPCWHMSEFHSFFFFFFNFFFFIATLFIYFWLCWVFGSCEGFLWLRQVGATLHRGAGTALHRGHSFLRLHNIPLYDGPHFVFHSSIDGHLGCFHVLAIVSNAALNTGVPISIQVPAFRSLGCIITAFCCTFPLRSVFY